MDLGAQNTGLLDVASNEKLVTLKALDKSILSAIKDGEIESEIEECENFRGQIQEALVKLQSCQVVHDQQENPQSQETHQETKSSGNKSKLPKLTSNKFNGDPKRWQEWLDSFCVAVHDNTAISKTNHLFAKSDRRECSNGYFRIAAYFG